MTLRVGSLFSGYGGLDLAVEDTFDARTVWHCENDPAASRVLAARWPGVPNLGDITAVDWMRVEPVDVLCGGSPCQDVSAAGKRSGMRAGTRSGLWASMCDAIDTLKPSVVVWENVRGVTSACADSAMGSRPRCVDPDSGVRHAPRLRALGRVLGDLADLGFDAEWCGLRAADVGAPHGRYRIFVIAHARGEHGQQRRRRNDREPPAHADYAGPQRRQPAQRRHVPDRGTPADTPRVGRHERRTEPTRIIRRRVAGWINDRDGRTPADTDRDGRQSVGRLKHVQRDPHRRRSPDIAWGKYEPAIRRWERILGRPAPVPTEPGTNGGQRLSPRFVEWMMGLPAGWVTDVPDTSRNDQLRMLGNGVVPQQAAAALRSLLAVERAA
jgi:DNA (cytosine-5)-methyltransferase 1